MSMGEKEKRERAAEITAKLKKRYPSAECALKYEGDGWRLLVMGRLSAQCTDARVNIVCRELFEKYPDAYAMAEAPVCDIERIVRPCGVYHVKARNIKDFSYIIVHKHNGVVPDNMDGLLSLPGVGRKIANLILGDVYGVPGIVADTHCIRISNRLGLAESHDPANVEKALSAIVDKKEQTGLCHRFVMFGRDVCKARNPDCEACPFKKYDCNK